MVVGLGADPQRLGEALGAGRDEHELLEVERVLRVRAAVDDVHQRHRQDVRVRAADPAVERQAGVGGRRLRDGERGAEDRVRAEPRLRRRPVELDQRAVDLALVGGVEPDERVRDLAVDVGDGARRRPCRARRRRRRGARRPRARRSTRRTGRPQRRTRRTRARPRPRPSGCPASRAPGGRGRGRSALIALP